MRATSVSESFKSATKQLLQLRKEIGDLESSKDFAVLNSRELDLQNQVNVIGATLGALLKALPQGSERELWKRKIQNAQNELKMVGQGFRELCKQRDVLREEEESKKLLQDKMYDFNSVKVDTEYKINESASNSINMVTQYIEMGRSTLAEFRRQREILEGVQARLIDAGHTMGLSSSMMAVIQRRDFVDRMIVFGGMFIVSLIVVLLWWYRR